MEDFYLQPEFYKFGDDSLGLIKFFLENSVVNNGQLIELGAGCGIITCEILQKRPELQGTLLEKQEDFKEFLKHNISEAGIQKRTQCVWKDVLGFSTDSLFDVCVFNPPYFFHENSRPSEDSRRDVCRRISGKDFNAWISKAHELIKPGGQLFFCHRENDLLATSWDLKEICRISNSKVTYYCWERTLF